MFNKRLEVQPDGELAMLLDVEVLNEERFREFGGFSISFSRRKVRIGTGDEFPVRVSINPQQFDFDMSVQELTNSLKPSQTYLKFLPGTPMHQGNDT